MSLTIKPYNKCKKENYLTQDEREFDAYRTENETHHEVITGRCRPYFDFERDFDDEETMTKHKYSLLKEAHDDIKRLYRKCEIILGDSSGFSTSKNTWRVSGRFFVRGAGYYNKPEHLKSVAKKLTVEGFDQGVYHTEKTMRNFYCHKEGEPQRLLRRAVFENKKIVAMDEHVAIQVLGETWRDWLTTDTFQREKERKCLSPQDESESECDDEDEPVQYNRPPMKLEEIRMYLKALSDERATNRNQRRCVIMALAHLAEYQKMDLNELAHDFAVAAGDNYDDAKVDELYNNPGKNPFTFNLVIGWARKDTPDLDEVRVRKPEAPKPTYYKNVCDLLVKKDLTLDELKAWMMGCLAKVLNNGNSVIFARGEDEWTLLHTDPFVSRIESYKITLPNPAYDKKRKNSSPTVDVKYADIFAELQSDPDWLKHCCFDRVNFKPFVGDKSPHSQGILNLFKPLKFQPRKDFRPTGLCDLLISHIRTVLAAGNDEHFEYIMDWIAQIFQQPENKIGICMVFRSKQRAGKNTVFDFIRRKMLPGYAHELTDMDQLTQKHNSHRMNSLFTVLNEVQNYGGAYKSNDKLKSIITDPQIFIEPKGREGFYIDDVCRYVMLTNNAWPVKKTEDDGRYACFDCSNEKCGDHDYFQRLHESLTDACAEEFYQTLMTRDLTKRNFRKLPETKFGAELAENSVSSSIKFMVDVADRVAVLSEEDTELRIHRDTLYESYTTWAKSANFHVASRDLFVQELAKVGLDVKPVRVSGRLARGILITVDELRSSLRKSPAYAKYEFQD